MAHLLLREKDHFLVAMCQRWLLFGVREHLLLDFNICSVNNIEIKFRSAESPSCEATYTVENFKNPLEGVMIGAYSESAPFKVGT